MAVLRKVEPTLAWHNYQLGREDEPELQPGAGRVERCDAKDQPSAERPTGDQEVCRAASNPNAAVAAAVAGTAQMSASCASKCARPAS